LSDHLNKYREKRAKGKGKRVPKIAYNVFKSRFQIPAVSEGFSEVKQMYFVPKFDNEEDKQSFLQWT